MEQMEQISLKNSPAKNTDCWVILDSGMCVCIYKKKKAVFQMDQMDPGQFITSFTQTPVQCAKEGGKEASNYIRQL